MTVEMVTDHREELAQVFQSAGFDASTVTADNTAEFFSLIDTLLTQYSVRHTLTDPNIPSLDRANLARSLFSGRVSDSIVEAMAGAVELGWKSGLELARELELQLDTVLLASAAERRELDQVRHDLFVLYEVVDNSQELRNSLDDEFAPVDARERLLASILADKANWVSTVLAKRAICHRDPFLESLRMIVEQASELRGHCLARVWAARELSEDQQSRMRAELSRIYGTEIDLEIHIDTGLLGGVRVEINNDVIDGSMLGRLEQAKYQLKS